MIELRTLGGLELLQGGAGQPRAIPLQAKRLALLAYLATSSPNGFRRRDKVLALFWPDLDQGHARGALRQALHFIRKSLGDGAIVSRGEDEIGLNWALVGSDASRLEAAVQAGESELALTLYRGDFLEGVFVADAAPELEDWIAAERARLRALAAKAAWLASERPARDQDTGEHVRRAVLLSGDDESALRRGIARLEARGDRVGAAALYEEFSRRVARDLDVDLSPETQEAMRAVRARRAAAAPLDSSPAGLVSVEAPTSSGPPEPSRTRPLTRKLFLAAAGGATLILALAAYFRSSGSAGPIPSPNRVAVLPFRVTEADSSLAWLREGIVELLSIRISGEGGPELASPSWVLAEWSRLTGDGRSEPLPDAARKVATRVGAGRIIEGAVTGAAGRVTLSAHLSTSSRSGVTASATVEGAADSLPQLIDRLAAQLLGLSAGMDRARLSSLTSTSLPAIRAFLRGEAAFRSGRMAKAAESYREATTLDSSFALAGLRLSRAASWTGSDADAERGLRLALAGRERLGRRDRVLLDAISLPDVSASTFFAAWDAAISAAPDNPEAWYLLGDAHYHWGRLAGEEDALQRAEVAFRRGWVLDSLTGSAAADGLPVPEPATHLVALAHLSHDTAAVLRLTGEVLEHDSSSDLAHLMQWHRASVSGDAARRAYRDGIASVSEEVLKDIHLFILWTGVGTEDLGWLSSEDIRRLKAHDPGWAAWTMTAGALNAGRPGDAPRAGLPPGSAGHRELGNHLRRALWWEADTTMALAAAASLQASAESASGRGTGAVQPLYDLCALGEWRAVRGDHRYAAVASARLRAARPSGLAPADSAKLDRYTALCGSLLDAIRASDLRMPDARARIAAADSVARENIFELCCGDGVTDANLQLARLWEREGDLPRALAAVKRRTGGFPIAPYYLSTFLREEGRLSLLIGDTAAAVRAYRHYLALRPDPEPQLRPGVDSIRREVASLAAH
ncbi:MAG TPA: hypothetical protein PKA66_10815 [Gemmatimonadales bacterium]|nr:hypothetical protein [Gemmatimonadales bacterium]